MPRPLFRVELTEAMDLLTCVAKQEDDEFAKARIPSLWLCPSFVVFPFHFFVLIALFALFAFHLLL